MRLRVLVAVCAMLIALGTTYAKGFGVTGSFVLNDPQPVAGQTISFTSTVTGIPEQQPDGSFPKGSPCRTSSCDGWIELTCTQDGAVVLEGLEPIHYANTNPDIPEVFLLHFEGAAQCEAYLFWDTWNNPRRRSGNTLAAIFFPVAAAP